MGYYTKYIWDFKSDKKHVPNCEHEKPSDSKFCPECGKPNKMVFLQDVITTFLENNEDAYYGISPNPNDMGDSGKCYDHNEKMIALSKEFPLVTFILTGYGEEREDVWRKYYKNGEMRQCQVEIVFGDDPFENEK